MARLARGFWLAMTLAAWLCAARMARAADEAIPVVVVDVAPGASVLDAEGLRKAIGQELHERAVAPDDPAATTAKGTLTVDVDRGAGQLLVRYATRTLPTTRHVPLPDDPAATRRAIVALAGNLARDEAGELAAELRGARPGGAPAIPEGSAAPATSGTAAGSASPTATPANGPKPSSANAKPAPTPTPTPTPGSDGATAYEIDPVRLRTTVDYYAAQERASRNVLRWTSVGLVFVGLGGQGILDETHGPDSLGVLAGIAWTTGSALALDTLFLPTPFEDLAEADRRGAFPAETEARWARLAEAERTRREVRGIVGLSAVGVCWGVATYLLAANPNPSTPTLNWALGAYGAGAVGLFLFIPDLVGDGPVESGLHAYEIGVGRTIPPVDAPSARLQIAPVPGGAFGSVTMQF